MTHYKNLGSHPKPKTNTQTSDVFWTAAGGRDLYEDTITQLVGYDSCHPPVTGDGDPPEVLLQVAARDMDRKKLQTHFAPQLVPRVLATIPGITYLADQGRPRPSGVVGFWPALISRGHVPVEVTVGGETVALSSAAPVSEGGHRSESHTIASVRDTADMQDRNVTVPLSRLCLARSGDKGDTCNVGVIARSESIYIWMLEELTADFVKSRFEGIVHGEVERFKVPNLLGLNFLLHRSLATVLRGSGPVRERLRSGPSPGARESSGLGAGESSRAGRGIPPGGSGRFGPSSRGRPGRLPRHR